MIILRDENGENEIALTEEEYNAIEDELDMQLVIERTSHGELDDEENLIDWDEAMEMLDLKQSDEKKRSLIEKISRGSYFFLLIYT